jgi:hypothetical protein
MELLLDGRWHPNHELARVAGLSFNDSIFALRREGWLIESCYVKGGTWEFRLVGKGDPPTGHKAMSRPQAVVAGHYMHVITKALGMRPQPKCARDYPSGWCPTRESGRRNPAPRTSDLKNSRDATG